MSSMSRSIRRQAMRQRQNTIARKTCPECGSIMKAQSDKAFKCSACKKRFIKVSKKA